VLGILDPGSRFDAKTEVNLSILSFFICVSRVFLINSYSDLTAKQLLVAFVE